MEKKIELLEESVDGIWTVFSRGYSVESVPRGIDRKGSDFGLLAGGGNCRGGLVSKREMFSNRLRVWPFRTVRLGIKDCLSAVENK